MSSSKGFRGSPRGAGEGPRLAPRPEPVRLAASGVNQRIGGGSITAPGNSGGNGTQIAGLYDLEETLGEGHYAVVKSARHVFTGERVAVKVIDKTKLDAATRVQMMQEVRLMKLVQHPHVVRLYEVIDTQTKLYLVLELADGGDMYDYIMRHEGVGLDESAAKKYFRQIVQAIQYCHELHVVHRDLKPENVVFFQKLGLVKLTDFGFSNKFDPGEQLQTSCGSLAYSAPEILLGDAYDAPAVDIWSLGVILYMLVCGAAPFQEANDSETLTMIMDCKYSFPSHISPACKRLVALMLQRQPHLRASLEDIIKDPWLNENSIDDNSAGLDSVPTKASLPETTGTECTADITGDLLPLVSREHLTEEEHSNILQRMVNGSVAEKEDIIDALDCNEYNHITATYFLLAERKLRSKRTNMGSPNLTKPDMHIKSQQPDARVSELSKPTKLGVSVCQALVEPVVGTVGAVASTTMAKVINTPESPLSSSDPFSIVNHPLLSPPNLTPNNELSSNTSILSHLLAATTDVAASTAISSTSAVNKHAPRLLQGKFLPGKHRRRRPMPCSIVEEECGGIVEEDEEELEEEEEDNDDYETRKVIPAVSLNRRGSGGSVKSGHVYSAGILSTEPALHSSTPPLPIIAPSGIQTNLLSVRRRSSDRSSNSSRSSDGATGAKVGSPVDRGTSSPKTPAPFPISSQIGSGSLSRQGSLNRGRTSDRSAATSHSSTPNSASERSSPSSPPGSNTSSNHSSPVARTRITLPGAGVGAVGIGVITGTGRQHKLVATRSPPQLMHHATQPALKEIHEECEETGSLSATGSVTGSPVTVSSDKTAHDVRTTESVQTDLKSNEALSIVDTFPTTRAGVAVIRRLEQRRRLRMHQARTASCSSSEASEDEAGSGGNVHSKMSTSLSSALVDKGVTTLARISERPQSSPGTSQRSGKKRHGVTVGQTQDRQSNDEEEEEKLSPFQSACTQPRLRKGRENSNQDDSSDNQDSGAPKSKGGGSSHIITSSTAVDESAQGGEKQVHGSTGDKNSETQKDNDERRSCMSNVLNVNIPQQPLHLNEPMHEKSNADARMEKTDLGTTRMKPVSRKGSVDSTEDSSEWDDTELTSILPRFPTIDDYRDNRQMQFSADDSSPSSLECTSKSPSPRGPLYTRTSLNSATSGFPILTQRLAKIQEGRSIATNLRNKRGNPKGISPDLKGIGEESDIDDDYMSNSSIECYPRIQPPSILPITLQTEPRGDFNSPHNLVDDKELQRTKRSIATPAIQDVLPSKFPMLKQSIDNKPLYRAHSCGSLFSLQHAKNSGHITVRHRRLSSQLCLPVESLPGVAFGSMATNVRSAHVTATVFIDIYAPYSPASPTLIGSPISPPSSGDDMPSFKGFNRNALVESSGIPILH